MLPSRLAEGRARIAVITPVYHPDLGQLRHAIRSVLRQTEDAWEFVLVDDGDDSGHVDAALGLTRDDPRVTWVRLQENRGISYASNAALERVTAPWIALLDQDDVLEPSALAEVLGAANCEPMAEIIYTDRDEIDQHGIPTSTFHKPDWSPQRLRGNMYVAHLTALATAAVRQVGGFRSEFDGAQDHDLVLRVAERGLPVVHVPRVLYHWRQSPSSTALDPAAKPYASVNGRRAIQAHLDRRGIAGTARNTAFPGFYTCELRPSSGRASIIVPTRGSRGAVRGRERVFVLEAVRSIVESAHQADDEIVVVFDEDVGHSYLGELHRLAGERLVPVSYRGPFNFAAKINSGVAAARGDTLVLLNDDVEVITPGWLQHLVGLVQEPDVGASGAKLLYEDGSIQHAGHCFVDGDVTHVAAGAADTPGDYGSNLIDREVVGVTAACMALRREVWDHVGGLDESLPNNFNDVDLCMRIRAKGYRIVQANTVSLYHFESRTRSPDVAEWEANRIRDRLGPQLHHDPFTPPEATRGVRLPAQRENWATRSRDVLRDEGARALLRKARVKLTRG